MTRSAAARHQDWSNAAVEVNENDAVVTRELRELLLHLHFLLPPQLRIPALQRAFRKMSARNLTQKPLDKIHLMTAFGRYAEGDYYRKTHGRMMARIHSCAVRVRDNLNQGKVIYDSRAMSDCENVIDACKTHHIKPFRFMRPEPAEDLLRARLSLDIGLFKS